MNRTCLCGQHSLVRRETKNGKLMWQINRTDKKDQTVS